WLERAISTWPEGTSHSVPRTVAPGSSGGAAGTAGAERGMGRRQPGQRDPEGRARHVVKADLVAEVHRGRVAAVLAADAELECLPGRPALGAGPPDQFADARLVEGFERIGRNQLLLKVRRHDPALDVVAGEPERHLRQVVGA